MGIALRFLVGLSSLALPHMAGAETALVSADTICADKAMSYQDRTDALRAAGWREGADDSTRQKAFLSARAMRDVPVLGAAEAKWVFDGLMAQPAEPSDLIADKGHYSFWMRDGGAGTLAMKNDKISETVEAITCQYVGITAGGAVRPLLTTSPLAYGIKQDDLIWPTSYMVDLLVLDQSAVVKVQETGQWNPIGLRAYEFVSSDLAPDDYPLDYNVLYEVRLEKETPRI